MRLTGPPRKYVSKEARRLREHSLSEVLPHAMHGRYWQRGLRWLREFEAWVRPFLRQEARETVTVGETRTTQELLRDNELCGLFVRSLFKKEVSFSVPRACRRHLSGARIRLGLPSLNEDVELSELTNVQCLELWFRHSACLLASAWMMSNVLRLSGEHRRIGGK